LTLTLQAARRVANREAAVAASYRASATSDATARAMRTMKQMMQQQVTLEAREKFGREQAPQKLSSKSGRRHISIAGRREWAAMHTMQKMMQQ
jgi:hypothetical protein